MRIREGTEISCSDPVMVFRPTDFFQPESSEEVCELLSKYGKHARIIAGGTAIYELAKRGLADEVQQLISLRKLPLKYVRGDAEGLHVGAAISLSEFLDSDQVRSVPSMRILSEALHEIRPVQVRAVATVGGEICTSLPLLDLPTALLAVDTRVVIQGPKGRRSIPLEQFLVDFFLNALRKGEFMIEALVPLQPPRSGATFMKFGRTAYDFNLVNVGVRLALDDKGICSEARIFLGGVGRVPMRVESSEAELRGKRVEDRVMYRAVEAIGEFKVIPQIHGAAEYKRDIAKVMLRESLKRASERALSVSRHE